MVGDETTWNWLRTLIAKPGRRLRRLDGAVREDLYGARHGISYLRHLLRGNRVQRRIAFDAISEVRPPVLLIHGYLGTRGSMFILERRLIDDGLCVFSFNLGTLNVRDIRRSAQIIQRKIESILAQTPVKKIDVIGHSMGGLIGLYYVKKLGGHQKVRRLVMLGTPVRGTWAALLGVLSVGAISESAWQLLPSSDFLAELGQGTLPSEVDFFTIAAQRDWLCPPESTLLDGADSFTVPLGHSSLVMSEEVYRHIGWALRK